MRTYLKRNLYFSVALLALSQAATVFAGVATVTTTVDTIDIDWATATLADLPGPDGVVSLSEAFIATNNTPGHDTIGFAIPLTGGQTRADFFISNGFFLRASDTVTVDGTTQTAFAGDTNPAGAEVRVFGSTLYLNADNSTLKGFDSTDISLNAANGLIEANTGTSNISLFGGGGSLIQDNTGGTIKIDRSSNNVVVGNTVQRVRVWGFGAGQYAVGNQIGGPNPEDRNLLTGYGTYNSEGLPAGTTVELFDTVDTVVENNWIGTADGLTQGNLASTMGVEFKGTNQGTLVKDNLISGILGHGIGPHYAGFLFGTGIFFQGTADNIDIVGNTIGLDVNGDPLLGSVTGIDIGTWNNAGLTNIHIGGRVPGEGNTIAGHILNGVTVGRQTQQAQIAGNSVWSNGGLGIELIANDFTTGVTPNDLLDADIGANGLQNFPDITFAGLEGSGLHVSGVLQSEPSTDYTIDFYASPTGDPSGFGEGREYLGSTSVITDAAGNAAFDSLLTVSAPNGWVLTSTATNDSRGATSEFSAWTTIVPAPLTADFNGDGYVSGLDLTDPVLGWEVRYGVDLKGSNFLDWQRELGIGALVSSTASAVPEPPCLLSMTLLTTLLLATRNTACRR